MIYPTDKYVPKTGEHTHNFTIVLPGSCSSKCRFCFWNRADGKIKQPRRLRRRRRQPCVVSVTSPAIRGLEVAVIAVAARPSKKEGERTMSELIPSDEVISIVAKLNEELESKQEDLDMSCVVCCPFTYETNGLDRQQVKFLEYDLWRRDGTYDDRPEIGEDDDGEPIFEESVEGYVRRALHELAAQMMMLSPKDSSA